MEMSFVSVERLADLSRVAPEEAEAGDSEVA